MNYQKCGTLLSFLILSFIALSENLSGTCEEHYISKQWLKAQLSCESELNKEDSKQNPLSLLSQLTNIYSRLDNMEKELFYLNAVKNHPEFRTNLLEQYYWYRRMGQLAYYKTNYQDTENFFEKTFEIASALNDKELQSKSFNDLGNLYNITGDYSKALEYYKKSLALKLELTDYYAVANTYSNIGSLLSELEKPLDSIDYLISAIEYYQKVDTKKSAKMITHVYEELSMAYLKSNQNTMAEFYVNKILASNKLRTTNEEQSNARLALAKYYNEQDKPEIAQMLLTKENYSEKPMYFLVTSLELAKTELELKNIEKAKEVALEGLKRAKQSNDIFYQFNFNLILSQIMEIDKPELALSYLKDFQLGREEFLQMKYDSKIDTIEFQIKKHKFDKDLLAEQLVNSEKQKRITTLTNWILIGFLLLMTTFIAWALYIYQKRKEKLVFLEQIKYHTDQLELLNAAAQERDQDQKVTEIITKDTFKETLIKAMVEAIDIWSRHTGKNRIDLAEKSKVWTVTIDNGTLRTRSMDKYLSQKNIPANPRWRKVVRTCHFILSDSSLNSVDRNLLNDNLNKIMKILKEL